MFSSLLPDLRVFLQAASRPLIVILGPTGAGKTGLSLKLARECKGEIVNADSRQIYREMDIGTNKVLPAEMNGIPHHLLSFKDPDEVFTVAEYKNMAVGTIDEILTRKHIPFLVGGTGLYINAVAFNYTIPEILPDYELRALLEKELEEKGNLFVHERLRQLDPIEAQKIHPNQKRYLVRALEIALKGSRKSEIAKKEKPLFDCFFIGLDIPRDVLYKRIDQRVEEMFEKGLLEEVRSLLEKGYDQKAHAMNGIGYKEVLTYLRGEISFRECKASIAQNTRHYAKRQGTWFRRIEGVQWVTVLESGKLAE